MRVIVGARQSRGSRYEPLHVTMSAKIVVVEELARRWRAAVRQSKTGIALAHGTIDGEPVLIVEPQIV